MYFPTDSCGTYKMKKYSILVHEYKKITKKTDGPRNLSRTFHMVINYLKKLNYILISYLYKSF